MESLNNIETEPSDSVNLNELKRELSPMNQLKNIDEPSTSKLSGDDENLSDYEDAYEVLEEYFSEDDDILDENISNSEGLNQNYHFVNNHDDNLNSSTNSAEDNGEQSQRSNNIDAFLHKKKMLVKSTITPIFV